MEVTTVTLAPKRFGVLIRQKRLALGLTQEQLANRAGITKNYVTMVESGARKNVDLLVRLVLADTLGIPPLEVLAPEEQSKLRILERAITLEASEVYVWGLQRCIQAGERPATGSKYGAQLALRRVVASHPERKKEIQEIRSRLNDLYP